jgi:uncharacterized membrane protein
MTVQTPPAPEVPVKSTDVPGTLDDRTKKSFDFLQDATEQLIALATAILTFTITFLKDIAKNAGDSTRIVLTLSWIALVVSAIAGLFVLLNLTGVLTKEPRPDFYKASIRFFSFIQLLAFGLALILALVFGWSASS